MQNKTCQRRRRPEQRAQGAAADPAKGGRSKTPNLNSLGSPTRASILGSGDELRLAIDTIPALAWAVLPDGKLEFLNRRWLDYSGLSLQEAIEQPTSTIHSEDLPRVLEKWRKHMVSGESYEDEMRLRRADGEYRWFLVRTVPLVDEQGKIVKWYGTSADIEDRKQAEEAVRESQQLLSQVLATLPVGVAVTDRAGNIVLDNAASKRIWGDMIVSGSERWARSRGFWHDSGKRITAEEWPSARALSEGRIGWNDLIDMETLDGKRKTMQSASAPIRDAEGQIVGAVIVNEDVTEQVRAQAALRESARWLQHLSRRLMAVQEEERRNLSRELHDEFGQILAAITLHLQSAKGVAGPAAQRSLQESMNLLQRAGAQVRSLALELRPTMLETAGLDATVHWLAEQHERRTGVVTEVIGHLNEVTGDLAIACFRVAQEALTNVLKHSRALHVWIELSQSERALELVIRDDGVGFDVTVTLEQAAALGHLGLLGMKERVQIFGGSLEVDSKPARGTRIRISLPLLEQPVPEGAERVT